MPLLQQCPVHTQSFWLPYPRWAPGTAFIVVCHKWLLVFIFTYSPTYLSVDVAVLVEMCACMRAQNILFCLCHGDIFIYVYNTCVCVCTQREKQVNPFDTCD